MNDETRRVLDLLAQGKITADEAEKLVAAFEAGGLNAAGDAPADPDKPLPRWVRINIHKPAKEGRNEKDVNIRVPVSVVKGGMRLGAIIGTFAGEKAARHMRERGIDLDLEKINGDFSRLNGPEFEQLLRSLDEMNIEIDDGKSQVRISCE
jgi:hypothetical protein